MKEDDPERAILGTLIYSADQGILAAASRMRLSGTVCEQDAEQCDRSLQGDPFHADVHRCQRLQDQNHGSRLQKFPTSHRFFGVGRAYCHDPSGCPEQYAEQRFGIAGIAGFEADGQALLAAYGE